MEINYFKDKVFELLNDADGMNISDIEANDRENKFRVLLQDGSLFELEIRQAGRDKVMEKQVYITDEEREKCRKVIDAYAELYEIENILMMDAGRYGYVKLQYYRPSRGFEDVITFTDSRDMFEDLWQEWLDTQLFLLADGTPMDEMLYEEIFACLPKEKQEELMNKRLYFQERAEIDL